MRVDEAPGGQAGECRLYPALKLWVSGKRGPYPPRQSSLDALDQPSCIRHPFYVLSSLQFSVPMFWLLGTPVCLRPGLTLGKPGLDGRNI